jgi:hypothetical protein
VKPRRGAPSFLSTLSTLCTTPTNVKRGPAFPAFCVLRPASCVLRLRSLATRRRLHLCDPGGLSSELSPVDRRSHSRSGLAPKASAPPLRFCRSTHSCLFCEQPQHTPPSAAPVDHQRALSTPSHGGNGQHRARASPLISFPGRLSTFHSPSALPPNPGSRLICRPSRYLAVTIHDHARLFRSLHTAFAHARLRRSRRSPPATLDLSWPRHRLALDPRRPATSSSVPHKTTHAARIRIRPRLLLLPL